MMKLQLNPDSTLVGSEPATFSLKGTITPLPPSQLCEMYQIFHKKTKTQWKDSLLPHMCIVTPNTLPPVLRRARTSFAALFRRPWILRYRPERNSESNAINSICSVFGACWFYCIRDVN
jgi:hypothetical protein